MPTRCLLPLPRPCGFALPVVLVLLTVLTGLVVAQTKRTVVDERLGGIAGDGARREGAVQSVLRWCEAVAHQAPYGVPALVPADAGSRPAWREERHWADGTALRFTGIGNEFLGVHAHDAACVIEEATCELAPPVSPTGGPDSGCNGTDPRWKKLRITARVIARDGEAWRAVHAQSELRLFVE